MKTGIALMALVCSLGAHAHDPISAESAERYLQTERELRKEMIFAPTSRRAEAHYQLGVMLDEVRDALNAELAAHGKVQGLPAIFLLQALESRGITLPRDKAGHQYRTAGDHFARALELAPRAPFAADAGLRLLQARFHDSYEQDPLEWKIDERALASQIQLAQDLLARFPEHAAREDIEFIAAILYTRAARLPKGAERYAPRARAATEAFAARYPASLRAAAMPVLREALPPR
jgi:hypothetical protein